jgi:hypothetical protein
MFLIRNAQCRVIELGRPWGLGAKHEASCLRCQAESASTRNMERVLAELAYEVEEPPASVMIGLLSAMNDRGATPTSKRREFPSKAAGAAAMAAVSVAVIFWRRRAQRAA